MRLIPLPRRHRTLWLIAAIIGVATWGTWLAATGRAADYGNSAGYGGSAGAAAPGVPVSSRFAGDVGVAALPSTRMTATLSKSRSTRSARTQLTLEPGQMIGAATALQRADLAGATDPDTFARSVAQALLAYRPGTDFAARTDAVMAVSALPPLGSPAELAADLTRFTPSPTMSIGNATVTFAANSVVASAWATSRLAELALPQGSFAIDVTGVQTITLPGAAPVPVTVTVGITGACPPALTQCEIDRIFPAAVQQELDQ